MIAMWMAYATAIAALVAGAASLVERAVRAHGRPGRFLWAAALVLAAVLPAAPLLRAPGSAPVAERLAGEPVVAAASRSAAVFAPEVHASTPSTPAAPPARAARPATRWMSWTLASLDAPLLILWGLTSSLLALGLVVIAARLAGRECEWQSDRVDGADVLIARELGPAVVGVVRPRIVLPAWVLELEDQARELIVAHEQEHVRAGDARIISLGILAVVLCPWNPVLWWASRRLRLAVELDCDARVLARRPDVSSYSNLLLDVGRRAARGPLLAASLAEGRHQLERRIVTMTEKGNRPRATRVVAYASGAAVLLAAACATPRPARSGHGAQPLGATARDSALYQQMRESFAREQAMRELARQFQEGDSGVSEELYQQLARTARDLDSVLYRGGTRTSLGPISDSSLAATVGCSAEASPTGRRQLVILVPEDDDSGTVELRSYRSSDATEIGFHFADGGILMRAGENADDDFACSLNSPAARVRVSARYFSRPSARLLVLGDRAVETVVRTPAGRVIAGPFTFGGRADTLRIEWARGGRSVSSTGRSSAGVGMRSDQVRAVFASALAAVGQAPRSVVALPGRLDLDFDRADGPASPETPSRPDTTMQQSAFLAARAAWSTLGRDIGVDTVAVSFTRTRDMDPMRRETWLFYPSQLDAAVLAPPTERTGDAVAPRRPPGG